jgi:hypothetical protein
MAEEWTDSPEYHDALHQYLVTRPEKDYTFRMSQEYRDARYAYRRRLNDYSYES